ncbi:MAG: hypothetical protein JWM34_5014 [Ilumatobacteraceae bacterium]|nr:hypothetical protein [Ilumatobacteraceae bacterium]
MTSDRASNGTATRTSSTPTSISVEREISAPAADIFDLLNRPAGHVLLDGSGTVRKSLPGNPETMELGSRFRMDMRMGIPYRMWSTVVEWERDRLIAWEHGVGHHIWRYELTPTDNGTLVRETFDWSTGRALMLKAVRAQSRNTVAMTATLERIQQHFTS